METKPDWKRNLDALGSYLGTAAPAAPSSAAARSVSDAASNLLQALASESENGVALDAVAERIGVKFREGAEAAKLLEAARLISMDTSGVVPVVKLTDAGRQIASAPLAGAT